MQRSDKRKAREAEELALRPILQRIFLCGIVLFAMTPGIMWAMYRVWGWIR